MVERLHFGVDRLLEGFLPARLHRLARFAVSGVLATALYFVLVNLIVLGWHLDAIVASVCAYALAIVFSYVMQSRFTFRVSSDPKRQVVSFVAASCAGLVVSYLVMAVCRDLLGWPYLIGAGAVCVLIPVMNFVVFKHWVFAGARRA